MSIDLTHLLALPVEQVIQEIVLLDKPGCIAHLRRFQKPSLDFTDEYLQDCSLEQIRHILLAATLQARKRVGSLPVAG